MKQTVIMNNEEIINMAKNNESNEKEMKAKKLIAIICNENQSMKKQWKSNIAKMKWEIWRSKCSICNRKRRKESNRNKYTNEIMKIILKAVMWEMRKLWKKIMWKPMKYENNQRNESIAM